MQVTPQLNLTFPFRYRDVEEPDPEKPGKTRMVSYPVLWAFHTPISEAIFEANYRIIAAAKVQLYEQGENQAERAEYAAQNGVRLGSLVLRDAGRREAERLNTADPSAMLFAELRRLTFILYPEGDSEMLPVDIALSRKIIEPEEWAEVESALVFFTCGYAMALRAKRALISNAVVSLLAGQMTSLSATAFLASLRTSMTTATFEPPQVPSSVPS